MTKRIAAEEEIPQHFLAKILQQLVREGLLRSSKGPRGGFALRVPAEEIRLLDIVGALDGLAEYQRCVCGRGKCSDGAPCVLHGSWKTLRSRILHFLGGNTIADLAKTARQKRRSIGKQRRRRSSAAQG